jgi:ribonuclease P protein component
MLEKKNRICLDKEFDRAFKTGQSFYANILGLKVATNSLPETRFGLLVGLKVSKKAVVRNKIRRQIREIIKSNLDNLESNKNLVIIIFPLILDKNFQEIKDSLEFGLKQLRILKPVKKIIK